MSDPRDAVQLQDLLRTLSGAGGGMHGDDPYDFDDFEDFDDLEDFDDEELEPLPLPPIALPPEAELADRAASTLDGLGRSGCVDLVGEELGAELWAQYEQDGSAAALTAWEALVSEYLERAGDPVSGSDEPDPHQLADELMVIALPHLYAGHRTSRSDMVAVVGTVLGEEAPQTVDRYVEPLFSLGFLAQENGDMTMTALGKWGYRSIRLADGGQAPLLDELGDYPARDLLWSFGDLPDDLAAEAAARWIGFRDPAAAARELLQAASSHGSIIRGRAVDLLEEQLEGVADEAFAAYADDPLVGPYVVDRRRRQAGSEEALPLEASRILAIDRLLQALADRLLDHQFRDVPEETWGLAAPLLDRTPPWPVRDHPQVEDAYELIAEFHPHGKTRKLAKKALHQIYNPKER